MWNDEDNNPYSSFDRRDSNHTGLPQSSADEHGFNESPSATSNVSGAQDQAHGAEAVTNDSKDDEDDEEEYTQQKLSQKRDGYRSRVEQVLHDHPDLQILITDAGKNHESGGSYIAYTIRTGDMEVRRRYSEFASLRATLVNLHPTLIIPPIPEKHSMADYAAKPTKAKEDTSIIDLRKRMLAVFLNRCRKMDEVREDGFWWRFLDINASWSEVLQAPPASTIPKNVLKAPPLDAAHPTPAHQWLPIPATSAKLKSASKTSSTGTPTSPPSQSMMASSAAHTIPAAQVFGRFPPAHLKLSETDLDPYFHNFEAATKELEILLQGNIERVNRRTLTHLQAWATDMCELGARYNGFSLSEQSPTVAAAIERIGQAVDSTYIATSELSTTLGASFAEPMRESAQFAGVVRNVLRYRIMKRIQEEMTRDELATKHQNLDNLERSEQEARRIDQYLSNNGGSSGTPKQSTSSASASAGTSSVDGRREGDVSSVDSDFASTNAVDVSSPTTERNDESSPTTPSRSGSNRQSGGFVSNKIFGRISHAVHGIVDVDPERTRRDQIGKTKESLIHLDEALKVSEQDVKDASSGVLKDLKRFQHEKEDDLRRYMIAYAKCHIDWAKRNVETWREAKEEVEKIEVH